MAIPSPDDTLISAVDGMLGIPQRRGVPLPLASMPLPFVGTLGYSVSLVATVATIHAFPPALVTNALVLTVVFASSVLFSAFAGILGARRRLRDARAWSPTVAARYRSMALEARATRALDRYFLLAATVGMATASFALLGNHNASVPAAALFVGGLGITLAAAGRALVRYGDCAMPREPDALASPRIVLGT